MSRFGLALAAIAAVCALAPANAQSDADKQKLRQELIRKIDARLRKLRAELVRDVDRALGLDGKHTAKKAQPKKAQPKKHAEPGKGPRGFLGIAVRPLKPGMRELLGVPKGVGVLVDEVVERSASSVAGLRRTDVLLAWNGHKLTSEADLGKHAKHGRAGQTVKLLVLREGRKIEVEATLTRRGVPARGAKKTAEPSSKKGGENMQEKMLAEAMKNLGDPEAMQKMLEQFRSNPESAKVLEQAMKQFNEMMQDPQQKAQLEKMIEEMMGGGGDPAEMQKKLQGMLNPGAKKGEKGTKKGAKKDDIDEMLDDLLGKGGKKGAKPEAKKPGKKPGFLGVSLRPLDETMRTQLGLKPGEGLLIDTIVEKSPAAAAGLKRFDVLVAVGDTKIGAIDDIRGTLGKALAGAKLKLTVVRRGERKVIDVVLGERPEQGWK